MGITLILDNDREQDVDFGDTIVFSEGEFKGRWVLTEISDDKHELLFIDKQRQLIIYMDERMPIIIE